jgi:hypothetical protein
MYPLLKCVYPQSMAENTVLGLCAPEPPTVYPFDRKAEDALQM